jgi:hypothetical protein
MSEESRVFRTFIIAVAAVVVVLILGCTAMTVFQPATARCYMDEKYCQP